tara:strand:+ start:1095 stop:1727 length:633 start_codon:yes stop_codon:yes gene_type:complete
MAEIQIADVGLGNPKSIKNVLLKIGYKSELINKGSKLNSKLLFIPGVGNFDYASNIFNKEEWKEFIIKHLNNGNWLIGICLGMQILCQKSDEGSGKGLELIPGKFKKFQPNNLIKVPNMGWRDLQFKKNIRSKIDFTILNKFKMRFYFVHSYYYQNNDLSFVSGTSNHGINFPAIINKDKIIGFQFHPEKSHVYGMKLLKFTLSEIFKNG